MNLYTCKFEGLNGIMHKLNIEFETDPKFAYEILNLVEKSFLDAKEILDTSFSRFQHLNSVETFPDKSLVDMVIYYNSDGKYKNIISYYNVSATINEEAVIDLRLINPVRDNMTSREVERVVFNKLREPLWWEDYNKTFYNLEHNTELIRTYIKQKAIMRCYYNDKVYYFNIAIDEPNITDDMIEEGVWFVYGYK